MPRTSTVRKAGIGAVGILCAVLALAGCSAPASPAPTPTTHPSAIAAPPLPSATPTDSADMLFTISANVRAVDGSTIGIQLAAHTPVAYSDPAVADILQDFMAGCPTDATGAANTKESLTNNDSSLMPLTLSSNRSGLTFRAPVQLFLGGLYTTQLVSGPGIVAPSGGCAGIYTWTTSGEAHVLLSLQKDTSLPDLSMWRYAHYGFVLAPGSGATIESCNVTITKLGMDADLTNIDGWDTSQAATGSSCGIGYSGE